MRVKLLPISNLLKKSDDPYTVMRSSYLQKRKFDVYNGDLPDDDEF
jgi:phospholipid-binding lipoprotein MlaA